MPNEALRDNERDDLVQNGIPSHDITIGDLSSVVYRGRWIILCAMLLGGSGTYFFTKNIPNEYRSEALLSNAVSSSSSRLMGPLGDVASLAGINLGASEGEDKVAIALELIKTWGFLEAFIKENSLEIEVLAVNGWDRKNNKLLIDPSIYDVEEKRWLVGEPADGKRLLPSSWDMYVEIKDRIIVARNQNTGLVTLSVDHYSPHVAKKWVDLLVESINRRIQAADKEDAEKSINYLTRQIDQTDISDMRTVFYQLIEEQTKKLMLAEIRDEYVFKTLSPAKVAEKKFKPNRLVLIIIGLLIGVLFSVFVLFLRFVTLPRKAAGISGKSDGT